MVVCFTPSKATKYHTTTSSPTPSIPSTPSGMGRRIGRKDKAHRFRSQQFNNWIFKKVIITIIIKLQWKDSQQKETERNKTPDSQVMHNTISHHPLTDSWSIPEQQLESPGQFPPVYILGVMLYGSKYLFHQFRLAVLAVFPPGFWCPYSFTEHGKLKRPYLA